MFGYDNEREDEPRSLHALCEQQGQESVFEGTVEEFARFFPVQLLRVVPARTAKLGRQVRVR